MNLKERYEKYLKDKNTPNIAVGSVYMNTTDYYTYIYDGVNWLKIESAGDIK